MTSLLTARRKHLAATLRLHAHAKTMRLGAPAFARLICALWQSNPPLLVRAARTRSFKHPRTSRYLQQPDSARQAASAAHFELVSVVDPRAQGQERLEDGPRQPLPLRVGLSDNPEVKLVGLSRVLAYWLEAVN